MKIKYDPTSDVLSIEFRDTTVTTKRLTDDVAVDYDAEGNVAGLEVLDIKKNILLQPRDFAVKIEGIPQFAS